MHTTVEDLSLAEAQVPQDKSRTFEPGGKSLGSVSKVKIHVEQVEPECKGLFIYHFSYIL